MPKRAVLLFVTAALAACSAGGELVGTWQAREPTGDVTMVLLKNRAGSFSYDGQNLSAPIRRWWVDGDVLHYINVKDREQTMKVLSVQSDVLTVEEPLGSGRVTVWHRLP